MRIGRTPFIQPVLNSGKIWIREDEPGTYILGRKTSGLVPVFAPGGFFSLSFADLDHRKAFGRKGKQNQAEPRLMLNFPSASDDPPARASDQLRHMSVQPDQLKSVFDMRSPFLRDK